MATERQREQCNKKRKKEKDLGPSPIPMKMVTVIHFEHFDHVNDDNYKRGKPWFMKMRIVIQCQHLAISKWSDLHIFDSLTCQTIHVELPWHLKDILRISQGRFFFNSFVWKHNFWARFLAGYKQILKNLDMKKQGKQHENNKIIFLI